MPNNKGLLMNSNKNIFNQTPPIENYQEDVNLKNIELEVNELLNEYKEWKNFDNYDYWMLESISKTINYKKGS